MTTLSQKEREDLHDVFTSISEVKPSLFTKFCKLQIVMHLLTIIQRFSLTMKCFSYQK